MVPRTVYERVQGMDERFYMNSEEVDFQRRLAEIGVPRILVPEVTVTTKEAHPAPQPGAANGLPPHGLSTPKNGGSHLVYPLWFFSVLWSFVRESQVRRSYPTSFRAVFPAGSALVRGSESRAGFTR